jgi:hypothetical protein
MPSENLSDVHASFQAHLLSLAIEFEKLQES